MAKKKSWFNLLKRFFVPDTHSKPEKKEKRRKWVFGRLKVKRFASITAPATPSKERTVSETEEEQSKHALTVAIATAAATEAAVAAAQVAAEVVKLAGTPQTTHQCEREIRIDVPQQPTRHQCVREILELAAIKIQTAFRGYLAKKALRALKGIVRLQAIIRGRNVRRQAITTLKCLQSIVNIQSQVCARRFQMGHHCGENDNSNKQLQTLRDKIIKMDSNGQRRWDDSVLTKKEADAVFLSKKEAIMKRERIKEYAFSHRKSAEELEQNKPNGRWRYWLDQWVDTQVSKSKELEDLDTIWTPNRKHREDYRGKGLRQRSLQRHQYHMEGPDSPFHRKQNSLGDEKSFSSSPLIVPTYMAATESAKAKARSTSSPKLRAGDSDTCSESYSPYKHKLSLKSPLTSEVVPGRIGRASAYQQRSPSLKSVPGPIKSSRTTTMTTIKDLSLNSECSLLNWDRQSTFR